MAPDMPLSVIPLNRVKPTRDPLGEWSNTTCVVWKEIHQMFKLTGDLSVSSSIIHIRDFLPLRLDTGFKNWKLLNLHYVHQLFSNNSFKSFEQLRTDFKLPRTDFFRYLQLRSFILKHPNRNGLIEPSLLELYLLKIQGGEHMRKPITNAYRIIASMTKDNSCYVKDKWIRELQLEMSERQFVEGISMEDK